MNQWFLGVIQKDELLVSFNQYLLRYRCIQNLVKGLRWRALEKNYNFEGSKYVSGFKYVRVLNIHKFLQI